MEASRTDRVENYQLARTDIWAYTPTSKNVDNLRIYHKHSSIEDGAVLKLQLKVIQVYRRRGHTTDDF